VFLLRSRLGFFFFFYIYSFGIRAKRPPPSFPTTSFPLFPATVVFGMPGPSFRFHLFCRLGSVFQLPHNCAGVPPVLFLFPFRFPPLMAWVGNDKSPRSPQFPLKPGVLPLLFFGGVLSFPHFLWTLFFCAFPRQLRRNFRSHFLDFFLKWDDVPRGNRILDVALVPNFPRQLPLTLKNTLR